MDGDRRMTPEDSLDIIGRFMSQTRHTVLRDSYMPFLVWGWTTVIVALVVYAGVHFCADRRFYLVWFAIPVIGTPLVVRLQPGRNRVRTTVAKSLHSVWMMLTVLLVGFSAASFFVPYNVLFAVLMLLSIGCYVTGVLISYPVLQSSSYVGFGTAILLWVVGGTAQILIFAAAIAAMMIIPGYMMKKSLDDERA